MDERLTDQEWDAVEAALERGVRAERSRAVQFRLMEQRGETPFGWRSSDGATYQMEFNKQLLAKVRAMRERGQI